MADICITVPKTIRWSEYEKELDAVKDGRKVMNFRIPNKPKDVNKGNKCYVCHDGFLKGWMEIIAIGPLDAFECATTGKEWADGIYVSRSGEFHYLPNPIPMKGFQGYKKLNENMFLNENRESKNINLARKFWLQKGYSQQNAQEILDTIRHDMPNTRLADCKYLLGVSRMYDEGELGEASIIAQVNKMLKYIATPAHVNEYNNDLNGMSADEVISRFEGAAQEDLKGDMERSNNRQFSGGSNYRIVKVPDFYTASEYADYTDWCITQESVNYDTYTNGGEGIFYFCLQNGFENIPKEQGPNCPLDEYGLSMIAVSVNSDGSCNTVTCRWNHENGGNDNIMTPKQVEDVVNVNFYQTFKPKTHEEILETCAAKAQYITSFLNDETGHPDPEDLDEYTVGSAKFYVWDGTSSMYYDDELNADVVLEYNSVTEEYSLALDYAFAESISDLQWSKDMKCGYVVITGQSITRRRIFNTNTMSYIVGPGTKESDVFDCGGNTLYQFAYNGRVLKAYDVNGNEVYASEAISCPKDVVYGRYAAPKDRPKYIMFFTTKNTVKILYIANGGITEVMGGCEFTHETDTMSNMAVGVFRPVDSNGVYLFAGADKIPCEMNPVDVYYGLAYKDHDWMCFVSKGGKYYAWYPHTWGKNIEETTEAYINSVLTATGSQYYFDHFMQQNTPRTETSLDEDVSIKPFEPKDELNPKFWVNNKLNSKVRLRLLDIADDFVKSLDIRWVKPDDIVLTGSIANYNWTKYSDVDIHIIMDYKKVYEKTDFVKSYFDSKKDEWNKTHEDLKIYGFNVEMSVEDLNAPAVSSGVYSLEKNEWVTEPKDLSDAKLNKDYVESTAEKYIEKIDSIEGKIRKEKDAKRIEKLSDRMVSVFNKLKAMRKEGLKSKSKELSSGNIIWKILRAEGYIKKIWDVVNYNYDKTMSLNEGYWGYLPLQNDYILDDLHELADENITPLVKELAGLYKRVSKKDSTPIEKINVITTVDKGKEEKTEHKFTTSERKEGLQEIFQLLNKIVYLIWSAAEWSPSKLEKEGINPKKLFGDCIELLDDKVWIGGWSEPADEVKSYLKKLKHWVELLIDQPYDKGKERYDKVQVGKDLGFLHELDESVTGTDNKKASALYVYAYDKDKDCWCVLCAKRVKNGTDEEGGKWNPPMGHVHRGEDMMDGAIRECLEESGLDVKSYKSKIHLKDSHRWGNNYRLVIKDKTVNELKPGKGDEENEKFVWCPLQDISKKTWAYTCGENAEKYAPKTVTLTESQKKKIQEMSDVESITLYHGVSAKNMEYNLRNGGFVPRVCAEGGPEAIYLSEKQYNYEMTFEFTFQKEVINKKLRQISTVDYIFTDFIPLESYDCHLVKTAFVEYSHGIAVEIDITNRAMCAKQIRLLPEAYNQLRERLKKLPFVYERYIEPLLPKQVIVTEEQMMAIHKVPACRFLRNYLKIFRNETRIDDLSMPDLHTAFSVIGVKEQGKGQYKLEAIESLLRCPNLIRQALGYGPIPKIGTPIEKYKKADEREDIDEIPDDIPPLSIMANASTDELRKGEVFYNESKRN